MPASEEFDSLIFIMVEEDINLADLEWSWLKFSKALYQNIFTMVDENFEFDDLKHSRMKDLNGLYQNIFTEERKVLHFDYLKCFRMKNLDDFYLTEYPHHGWRQLGNHSRMKDLDGLSQKIFVYDLI